MISVFISYSHQDEALRDELQLHLEVLRRDGIIDIWHDRSLLAGQEFGSMIDERLNDAQIIVLLISHHFLASQYCYEIELERALQRHQEGSAHVIPVILSECDWRSTPIKKLVVLPKDGKPLTKYPDKNEAFLEVVQDIRTVAQGMGGVKRENPELSFVSHKEGIQPIIRSSNLRVKRQFKDHDRDRFLHDTFDYMAKYFEGSLAELSERNQEIETSFRKVDSNKFDAAIYRNGEKVSSCQIRIDANSPFGGSAGIAYSADGRPNSHHDMLYVGEGDQTLFMKTSFGGISYLNGSRSDRELTAEGAAEHYWSRLMEPLQR